MPAPRQPTAAPVRIPVSQKTFAVAAGLFLFIVVLKFGTPVILDYKVTPPESALAALIETWQLKWGFRFLTVLTVAAIPAVRWRELQFNWALALPLLWLGWQFISASQTVSKPLTTVTLEHFTACVLLFYLGYFALQGVRDPWPVWAGLALAVCCVIRVGFEQHFGGLEATRHYIQSLKDSANPPPDLLQNLQNSDYVKRLAGNRIFATFAYANALAGCFVLLLPVTLVFLWEITPKVRTPIRCAFVAILGGCGFASLYWSGSKAGWLVTVVMIMIALACSKLPRQWKQLLICGAFVVGIAGFGIRYAKYFHKQNNSMDARFIYWRAAVKIAREHPLFGTGPGTFSVLFQQMKSPTEEMARLSHNDYLEQACDSGLLGLLTYSTMIFTYLRSLYRYRISETSGSWLYAAVGLGLFGLCLHSLVEYHLYFPALAWPMFFLFGWSLKHYNYR